MLRAYTSLTLSRGQVPLGPKKANTASNLALKSPLLGIIFPRFLTSITSSDLFIFSVSTYLDSFPTWVPTLMLESETSATEFLSLAPDSRFNLVAMSISRALPQDRPEEAAACTAGLKALTKADFESFSPVTWLSKENFVSLRMEFIIVFKALFIN